MPETVLDFQLADIAILEEFDQFAQLAFFHWCYRPFSDAFYVVAGARIDLEYVTLIDKKRYLDDKSRLQCG